MVTYMGAAEQPSRMGTEMLLDLVMWRSPVTLMEAIFLVQGKNYSSEHSRDNVPSEKRQQHRQFFQELLLGKGREMGLFLQKDGV